MSNHNEDCDWRKMMWGHKGYENAEEKRARNFISCPKFNVLWNGEQINVKPFHTKIAALDLKCHAFTNRRRSHLHHGHNPKTLIGEKVDVVHFYLNVTVPDIKG